VKAIIFDMDGVLIDSMKYHVESWIETLKSVNINLNERDIYLNEGRSFVDTIKFLSNEKNLELNKSDWIKISKERDIYLTQKFKLEVYAGIIKFIYFLKLKGFKVAMVTGTEKLIAEKVSKEMFNDLFDVVISSDDVKHSKPDPEPYQKAIKKLKIKNEEAIVIENAPLGIKSAKDAGLFVIGLETTLHKKDLCEADIILKNHEVLFEYLKTKLNISE
jgi:beta-phosphoglucomutase